MKLPDFAKRCALGRDLVLDDMRHYVEDAMANGHVMRGTGLVHPVPDGWLSFSDYDMWGYVWPDRGAEGTLILGMDVVSEWGFVCQMDDASEAGKVEYRCDAVRRCGHVMQVMELAFVTGVACAPMWWDDMFE